MGGAIKFCTKRHANTDQTQYITRLFGRQPSWVAGAMEPWVTWQVMLGNAFWRLISIRSTLILVLAGWVDSCSHRKAAIAVLSL